METSRTELLKPQVVKDILHLLDEFLKDPGVPAEHFLLCQGVRVRCVSELFLRVTRAGDFLSHLAKTYYSLTNRRRRVDDGYVAAVILYLVLFHLNKESLRVMKDLLQDVHPALSCSILSFLCQQDALCLVARAGCKVFDIDYVREKIIAPLEENLDVIKDLRQALKKNVLEKTRLEKRAPTVPQEMQVLARQGRPYQESLPAQPEVKKFTSTPVPHTTKMAHKPATERRLVAERARNRRRSQRLLEEALDQCPQSALGGKSDKYWDTLRRVLEEREPHPPVAKRPPLYLKKAPLPVRHNAAAILREGAKFLRDQDEEIKRWEALATGSCDAQRVERLAVELQRQREAEDLEAVEIKHLKGLLTREEALLARQHLLQANRDRRVKYQQEKKELERKLERWRQKEEDRIRSQMDKCHKIKEGAREAMADLFNKRHRDARDVDEQSRVILEEATRLRAEELAHRVQVMKEIKALQGLHALRLREMDPTYTPGFGLMCEMSLAELSERLALLKEEMKEDLESRRKEIRDQKTRQQQSLKDLQHFVCEQRTHLARKKAETPEKTEIPRSKELEDLKRELEEKRKQRRILMGF